MRKHRNVTFLACLTLQVAAESEPENQKSAKWMTPAFQKRAFSDAWLSFMRLQIPPETFRKVSTRIDGQVEYFNFVVKTFKMSSSSDASP